MKILCIILTFIIVHARPDISASTTNTFGRDNPGGEEILSNDIKSHPSASTEELVIDNEFLRKIITSYLNNTKKTALPGAEIHITYINTPATFTLPAAHLSWEVFPTDPGESNGSSFTIIFKVKDEPVETCAIKTELQIFAPVVSAAVTLEKGRAIKAGDIRLTKRALPKYCNPFTATETLIGMLPNKPIPRGKILEDRDVTPPAVIKKGELVKILAAKGNLRLFVTGVAVTDGLIGEIIEVENIDSKKLIPCRVASPGIVIAEFLISWFAMRRTGEKLMTKVTDRLRLALLLSLMLVAVNATNEAQATHGIENMADLRHYRGQLMGYGLVIGLNGTGDDFNLSPLTRRVVSNMLRRQGVDKNPQYHYQLKSKNVALVMVCVHQPPFARFGTVLEARLLALRDAVDLSGGTLLPTPLTGFDGSTYALARGLVATEHAATNAPADTDTPAYITARVAQGAVMIKLPDGSAMKFNSKHSLHLSPPGITTPPFIANIIDKHFYHNASQSWNIGRIWRQPLGSLPYGEPSFVTGHPPRRENGSQPVPVVISKKNGMIVLGGEVRVSSVTISRGNINMVITESMIITQPEPLLEKSLYKATPALRTATSETESFLADTRVSTGDIAAALYAIGATPSDLIAFFMVIMAKGGLHGELIIL